MNILRIFLRIFRIFYEYSFWRRRRQRVTRAAFFDANFAPKNLRKITRKNSTRVAHEVHT